ncbi:MAG: hypothetical protein R2717_06265 [Schumannella sp.]|nr:hypothetical protein [Microbacteriaceae bacterium]
MASEEKSAWIMMILAIVVYPVYAVWVLSTLDGAALVDAEYRFPMLATIGGSIVASILLHIFLAPQLGKKDQREREIHRFGEYTGYAFITIGGLAAMVLAVFEFDHFWIANVVYLCFVLSAIIGSIAKIVAHRSGLPRW